MEIRSEPVEPRQVRLTIPAPPERVDKAKRAAAQSFGRQQRIPGYRPGKIPYERVAALVGEELILEEARRSLAGELVREAVRQEGLVPSGSVSYDIEQEDPLTIVALVPLAPEVDLGDYHALRVARPEPEEITDARIDETLDGWRDEMATLEPREDAAEEGDLVRVALVGRHDEKTVFEDEAMTLRLDRETVPEGTVPPDVVDELIGLSAGDEHAFALTYSEFWPQPELQNQEVAFEARMEEVMQLTRPELDDEFAQRVGDAESLEELRASLRERLEERAEMERDRAYVDAVIDALVAGATVSYPPALLEREMDALLQDLRARVERQGFAWERWLEMQKEREEEMLEDLERTARARVERGLVLTTFVDREGIRLSRDELEGSVKAFTSSLSPAARRGMPSRDELRQDLGSRILTNRALDRLVEIATGDAGAPAGGDEAGADEDAAENAAEYAAEDRAEPDGEQEAEAGEA